MYCANMNTRARTASRCRKLRRYLPWIFPLAIVASLNYTVQCARIPNVSDIQFSIQRDFEKSAPITTVPIVKQFPPDINSTTSHFVKSYVLFQLLISLIAIKLYLLILHYLNSQSLVKQCLLLYMYRDSVCVLMVDSILWFVAIVIRYSSDENGQIIDRSLAKAISFSLWCIALAFLVLMNFVAILKMYIMKKAIVDPAMPWGDNEQLGINIIRLVVITPILGFSTAMYIIGVYPKLYYIYIGNYAPLDELPNGTTLFSTLLIGFFINFIIIFLVSKCYESTKCQHQIETGIPSQLNRVFVICLIYFSFVILKGLFGVFGVRSSWYMYEAIPVVMLIIPISIILHTQQLKNHVKTYFSYDMWHLNVKFVGMCLIVYVFVGLCAT